MIEIFTDSDVTVGDGRIGRVATAHCCAAAPSEPDVHAFHASGSSKPYGVLASGAARPWGGQTTRSSSDTVAKAFDRDVDKPVVDAVEKVAARPAATAVRVR